MVSYLQKIIAGSHSHWSHVNEANGDDPVRESDASNNEVALMTEWRK